MSASDLVASFLAWRLEVTLLCCCGAWHTNICSSCISREILLMYVVVARVTDTCNSSSMRWWLLCCHHLPRVTHHCNVVVGDGSWDTKRISTAHTVSIIPHFTTCSVVVSIIIAVCLLLSFVTSCVRVILWHCSCVGDTDVTKDALFCLLSFFLFFFLFSSYFTFSPKFASTSPSWK